MPLTLQSALSRCPSSSLETQGHFMHQKENAHLKAVPSSCISKIKFYNLYYGSKSQWLAFLPAARPLAQLQLSRIPHCAVSYPKEGEGIKI